MEGDGFDDGPTPVDVELVADFADDAPTAPRCFRCGRLVQQSVTFEPTLAILQAAGNVCWRPIGGAWWFCSGKRPTLLVQYGED